MIRQNDGSLKKKDLFGLIVGIDPIVIGVWGIHCQKKIIRATAGYKSTKQLFRSKLERPLAFYTSPLAFETNTILNMGVMVKFAATIAPIARWQIIPDLAFF